MVTEMITLKLDDSFIKDVDKAVSNEGYHNRTEFIRAALREKLEKIALKKAILELSALKGSSKRKITSQEYETIRNKAFDELEKEFR